MSFAVAALVLFAGAAVVFAIDLLIPFDTADCDDDVERGSTTIMPEDR